ncbi:hypothetical protein HME7025_01641 [Aquirufa nivalisilvae]|uniref:Uncharacterized protein n=1 Tax=Aquirufa nivalisilvae TaxID=2516557 RepID=A0A2S2DVN9_9BACT|nr:hypothetical protein [Aquirufa nivalisilvae]AWL09494.1 hypothetical protein HME7025_01641 [Aquirufa nivalisilvae]
MTTPITTYIDTNILNDIAPKGNDWTNSEWGKYLIRLSDKDQIEVWASPGNCLEIALNPDIDHRHNMARALNTLIKGQRMLPAYEFFVVDNLLRHIETNWEGTLHFDRLEFLKQNSSRIYISLLGQLAALKDYNCSKGFGGILRPKIITQIIHSTIFSNPKAELEKRLEAMKTRDFRKHDLFSSYDGKAIDELETIEDKLKGQKYTVDKKAVEWLKKNKDELVKGYSLDEVYSSLQQVFIYWEDLNNTIVDFPKIVTEWDKIYTLEKTSEKYKVKPLPDDLIVRFKEKKHTIADTFAVLKELANRFYHFLIIPQVYYYTIINEIEKALNDGEIPTGGLVIDSHHSIGSIYTNLFLTRDTRLLSTIKYWHSQIPKEFNIFRDSANDLNEFKRKVEKEIRNQS